MSREIRIIAPDRTEEVQEDVRRQDHLAAVAAEAIRVENGEFVHASMGSVVRELRRHIEEGTDPRVMDTASGTLQRHIGIAGRTLPKVLNYNAFGEDLEIPISEVVASPQFTTAVPYEGWRQTFRYAAENLPPTTTARDLSFLLTEYAKVNNHRDPAARINNARYWQGIRPHPSA